MLPMNLTPSPVRANNPLRRIAAMIATAVIKMSNMRSAFFIHYLSFANSFIAASMSPPCFRAVSNTLIFSVSSVV